ncbi:hypothetical protein BOTBODRAFT_174093 [Botryobasidium botryosum FD-172 SS1]|uniref:Uncharacterized protein n=1 Tax=Botryobasidium botryosum (strain FD-172 SS1) TaxID=930990 RepID=A0A067MUH7_BOTB1|nr:hypothetical protein BOTBODRAFT_174093 [Botryobasidium botryosum FD-172 SS1]
MYRPARTEYRKLITNDLWYRYELQTINTPAWLVLPMHPRLLDEYPPVGLKQAQLSTPDAIRDTDHWDQGRTPGTPHYTVEHPDGTYGECDWLYTPIAFCPLRPWVHYMPTPSMWVDPPRSMILERVPIFIKPTKTDRRLWEPAESDKNHELYDEDFGRLGPQLAVDLMEFWDSGMQHAEGLAVRATQYATIPAEATKLDVTLTDNDTYGTFPQMMARLVDTQRRIAELYGWIFLQEKLQNTRPSIVWNCRGLREQGDLAPMDHFMGVLVDWNSRSPEWDRMAIKHGVPLWWVDYAAPGTSEMPPWRGLKPGGAEAIGSYRGSGFTPVIKDRHTRQYNLGFERLQTLLPGAAPPQLRPSPVGPSSSQHPATTAHPAAPSPAQPSAASSQQSTATNPAASAAQVTAASSPSAPVEPSKKSRDLALKTLRELREQTASRRKGAGAASASAPHKKSSVEQALGRIVKGTPSPRNLEILEKVTSGGK